MTSWSPGPAWLFCPADRVDRYGRALAEADTVVLDLEDAVSPDSKPRARDLLVQLVNGGRYDFERTVLRVNAVNTPFFQEDLLVLKQLPIRRVMLPKVQNAEEVASLSRCEIIALIESPMGLAQVNKISQAANVVGMMWGADDLTAALGGIRSRSRNGQYLDVSRMARVHTLIAAKSAQKLALDAVYMDIPDLDGLRLEADDAVSQGFDGKVAIHPSQLPVIRKAYQPADVQVAWAKRLLDHVGRDRGVRTFEGKMVDGPIYAQAEQVIRLSTATGPRSSVQS